MLLTEQLPPRRKFRFLIAAFPFPFLIKYTVCGASLCAVIDSVQHFGLCLLIEASGSSEVALMYVWMASSEGPVVYFGF